MSQVPIKRRISTRSSLEVTSFRFQERVENVLLRHRLTEKVAVIPQVEKQFQYLVVFIVRKQNGLSENPDILVVCLQFNDSVFLRGTNVEQISNTQRNEMTIDPVRFQECVDV
jgi:hypothetical protein